MTRRWKNIVKNSVYGKEVMLRYFPFCVENNKYVFSSYTVKIYYKMFKQKLLNPPTSNGKKIRKLEIEDISKKY